MVTPAYQEIIDFIASENPKQVIGFTPSQVAKQRVFDLIEKEKSLALSEEKKTDLEHRAHHATSAPVTQ
jgi:predicted Rdx family selenoprotein